MKLVMSAVVASIVLSALPSAAVASPNARPGIASASKPVVRVSAKQVTEGDRLALRVRVPQPGDAKRVVLQERVKGFSTDAGSSFVSSRPTSRRSWPATAGLT